MLKNVQHFWQMPNKHKTIVFRAWCWFIYWDLLISFVPYRFWKNKLFNQKDTFSDVTFSEVLTITRLIEKVARHHFVKINCLRRCTVQKHILDKMGYPTQLVFGVKKDQDNLAAHCWLTFKNKIINDSLEETNHYVPLVSQQSEHKKLLKNLK